jgi:hyperosmotically inducible periplasmic protein
MRTNILKFATVLGLLLSSLTLLQAQGTATAPDNTGQNKQDRDPSTMTADQQKNNVSDRDLAREVRRAIVKDKSLSTYGHNVKVIAQNGTVTLKGPVQSEEEKHAIASKAAEVVGGSDKVRDELEITNH